MPPNVNLDNLTHEVLIAATDRFPRNMGADLIELADGRLLFGVSRWLGGAHDNDGSEVFGIVSEDDGNTWSDPFDIVKPTGEVDAVRMPNFMRLKDGSLACFCRHRASMLDTWTGMIVCKDEPALGPQPSPDDWTDPRRISPDPPGRHVLLNNRVVRISRGENAGRILLPLASPHPWDVQDGRGTDIRSWVLRSDDEGKTWHRSESLLPGPEHGLMEPYIVELKDGRLKMWMRTQVDSQYESVSNDGGISWTDAAPGPLTSPESPVAIGRHPASGLLAVVWNHNTKSTHTADRNPICIAFSEDEGTSWFGEHRLDPEPERDNGTCSFS